MAREHTHVQTHTHSLTHALTQTDYWTNGHLDLCAYKRRKNDWTNASSFHLRINYENWKVDHFSPLFPQPTFERCVPLYVGRCKNGPEVKSSELK